MTISTFFFLTSISLMLLVAAAPAIASTGNVTSELRYDGCAPGDTVGECITAKIEADFEPEDTVVRRILQQKKTYIIYKTSQKQPVCNRNIAGNCIRAANNQAASCVPYQGCKLPKDTL